MKKQSRHNAFIRLLGYTKRGVASLFVCSLALLPLISFANLPGYFFQRDSRKATALAPLSVREADRGKPTVKPFQEPLVSVTFDDGWESIYTVAAPLLQRHGIPSTQYILSGTSKSATYMSNKQLTKLQAAGHELACHTVNHLDLTNIDDKELAYELDSCKASLTKHFGPIHDFATPYGRFNDRVISAVQKDFRSHRDTNGDITNGVDENDINLKETFSPYKIIGVTIRRDTTVDQLRQAIDYTIAHNGWLVITYHQVDEDNSQFGVGPKELEAQLSYLSKTRTRIVPLGTVLNAMGK